MHEQSDSTGRDLRGLPVIHLRPMQTHDGVLGTIEDRPTVRCIKCKGCYFSTTTIQGGPAKGWDLQSMSLVRCLKCDEEYIHENNSTILWIKRYYKWD